MKVIKSSMFILPLLTLCLSACVIDPSVPPLISDDVRADLSQNRGADLAHELEKEIQIRNLAPYDQVLYLMDIGLAYHAAGDFEKSTQSLRKASGLVDETPAQLQIGPEAYEPREFERTLIHSYILINDMLQNKAVDTADETKILASNTVQGNELSTFLTAVSFEHAGDLQSSLEAYKRAHKLNHLFPTIKDDLQRVTLMQRRRHPEPPTELLIILEKGLVDPQKTMLSESGEVKLPKSANVEVDGVDSEETAMLYNVQLESAPLWPHEHFHHLDNVVSVLNSLGQEADRNARHWNLLPASFEMARIPVKPGVHTVRLYLFHGPNLDPKTIEVKAGQVGVLDFRYVRPPSESEQ